VTKVRRKTKPRRGPDEIASAVVAVMQQIAAGRSVAAACRSAGIAVPSYYRWRAGANGHGAAAPSPDRMHETILNAAKTVFLREGYAASLDTVAAAAGVARQTVYNQFGSKERLFGEVVQSVYQRLLSPILVLERDAGFISTLTSYGRHFMKIAFDPESLALLRITLGEYRDFPELAKITYALRASHTIPVFTDRIAEFLGGEMERGVIDRHDPLMAAEAFVGSFTAHARHRALVGMSHDTPERLEAMLRLCVDVFARGLGYRAVFPNTKLVDKSPIQS